MLLFEKGALVGFNAQHWIDFSQAEIGQNFILQDGVTFTRKEERILFSQLLLIRE